MEIKKNRPKGLFTYTKGKIGLLKKKPHRLFFFLGIFCFVFLLVVGFANKNLIKSRLRQLQANVKIKSLQVLSVYRAHPNVLKIDIGYEDYLKIASQREEAIKNKVLISPPNSFVNATVSLGNSVYDAKVRLKGLLSDHWRDETKWSLKFHIKNGESFLGLTDFSLMHPRTRNFMDEWLYTRANKREGVISPRVELVKATINGKDQGVYMMVENVGEKMIEENRRREGPIVHYSQDLLLKEWSRGLSRDMGLTVGIGGRFFAAPVIAVDQSDEDFNLLSYQSTDTLTQKAISILELFREGKLTVGQAFDMEKLTKYLALRVLFASIGFDPVDSKFYYNPITGKLEPIGSELSGYTSVGEWWINRETDRTAPFLNLFFRDMEFVEAYVKEVDRVSRPQYLDEYFRDIETDLKDNLNIFYSEFPDHPLDKNKFYKNQKIVNFLQIQVIDKK